MGDDYNNSSIEIVPRKPQQYVDNTDRMTTGNAGDRDNLPNCSKNTSLVPSTSGSQQQQAQSYMLQSALLDGSASEHSSTAISSSSSYSKKKRRRRPLFLEIADTLKLAHSKRHPWDFMTDGGSGYHDAYQQAYDRPDFNHLGQLTLGLLICTIFTIVSGWDATKQCLSHETSVVRELADDDNIQHHNNKNNNNAATTTAESSFSSLSREKCLLMLEHVMLPTGVASCILCIVALIIVIRHNRTARLQAQLEQQESSSPGCIIFGSGHSYGGVCWKSAVRSTIALTVVFLIVLLLQTYNIAQIMLEPRRDDDDNGADADDVVTTENYNNNPYQSLAAVDSFGQVGDNANLYYLTWFCQVLIITLTYQSVTACFRVCRAFRKDDPPTLAAKATTSWTSERTMRKQTRAAWYSSLYKLRTRTGVWTAACVTCVVIVASSQYIWAQVLAPYVERTEYHHRSIGRAIIASRNNPVCSTASNVSAKYFAPELCRRTMTAWVAGYVAAILCFTAVASHLVARYGGRSSEEDVDHGISQAFYHDQNLMELLADRELCGSATKVSSTDTWKKHTEHFLTRYYSFHHPKRLPLRTELSLSVVLSLLLGINAVLVTGVRGPAATVGNLYYASWLAFLLCIRICLGCVEEFYNIDDEDNEEESFPTTDGKDEEKDGMIETVAIVEKSVVSFRIASESQLPQANDTTTAQTIEKKRRGRVRGYFFLAIFSWVCAASAYDAGANQKSSLTREQLYMTIAPVVVAVIATLCFFISLSKPLYTVLRRFIFGGVLAVLCCGIWLSNLILTMHSDNSWAVNGIGEIEMANLYYFSWAAMITSGISMTSYIKGLMGIRKLDHMSTVWVVICKVCFVILGAALHVWHTISDNCEFDEITSGAVTFCSRTVLAICVALTGLFVGGLVVIIRFVVSISPCCRCGRLQAHAEMLVSLFLTLLFVAAVAMITCIGGPGQSVGDLYYSTWLAFWVSLGVFVTCLKQLQVEDALETTVTI